MSTTPTATQRLAWVDLIKGVSVVLVVFMHVVLTLDAFVGDTFASDFWSLTGSLLEPLRMPVFFVVSGMLAAGAVHRPWSMTRRRTLGIAYLYVLWTAILIAVLAISFPADGPLATIAALPRTLVFVASGYWYLFALVLFFVIARIARNLPPWLVVGVAAIPNLFRPVTGDVIDGVLSPWHAGSLAPSMALNVVFFLAGAYYKSLFAALTRWASWPAVSALGVVLVTAGLFRHATPELWSHTFLPLSVGWIVWAIMIGQLLTQHEGPRRFGSFMGARTLPIFVIQFPLLHLVDLGLETFRPGIMSNPGVQFVYPVAVTLAIVVLALFVHDRVMSSGARWPFEAPGWALGIGKPTAAAIPEPRSPEKRVASPAVLQPSATF